jgi:hypothetical protein
MIMLSLIYYSKTNGDPADPSRDLLMGLTHIKEHRRDIYVNLRHGNLDGTHVLVGQTSETSLDKIYNMYQGEVWSPNGEALELITHLGLSHTSMCVGDIVRQIAGLNPEDDRYFFCDLSGWVELW